MRPCGSDPLLERRMVAEIDHHRMKTPLEPAAPPGFMNPPRKFFGEGDRRIQRITKNILDRMIGPRDVR
jgi:hypothetical protein